jgi:hypothetical protein
MSHVKMACYSNEIIYHTFESNKNKQGGSTLYSAQSSGLNREQKSPKSPEKSMKVQKSPEKSRKVQKSPEKSRKVQKRPEKSRKVQKSPEKSRKVQKIFRFGLVDGDLTHCAVCMKV